MPQSTKHSSAQHTQLWHINEKRRRRSTPFHMYGFDVVRLCVRIYAKATKRAKCIRERAIHYVFRHTESHKTFNTQQKQQQQHCTLGDGRAAHSYAYYIYIYRRI